MNSTIKETDDERLAWISDTENVFMKVKVIAVNGSYSFSIQSIRAADLVVCTYLESPSENWQVFGSDILQYDRSHEYSVSDLGQMNQLNDAALLNTIRMRFKTGHIYTAMNPLVISVNPYYDIPDLYSSELFASIPESNPEKKGHIFTMVDRAIARVLLTNQSIVVRGESGAGKTEACKRILAYITGASDRLTNSLVDSSVGDLINRKLIACSPILESFGNAKTLRNDNSSRFGKYLRIVFSSGSDEALSSTSTRARHVHIEGAVVDHYLLERSRVVSQSKGERNYHVFYQMMVGADSSFRDSLGLTGEAFTYLRVDGDSSVPSEDAQGFRALLLALNDIDVNEAQSMEIFRLLAAVLHLGNISVLPDPDNEWASVCDTASKHYQLAERILGVSNLNASITSKTVASARGRGSVIKVFHTAERAIFNAAAIAKEVYDRLFIWLVAKCNASLRCRHQRNYIGLLDLFGFEVFEVNSFEQLCINYCNEKLQALFNETLFKEEIKIYEEEGISASELLFSANKDCLDLFEGDRGIFKLIDEQCALGRSQQSPLEDAAALMAQMEYYNTLNSHFSVQPSTRKHAFSVFHFAGRVEYSALSLISKNTDKMDADLEMELRDSDNAFLGELFEDHHTSAHHSQAEAANRDPPASSPLPKRRQTVVSKKRSTTTVGAKFRASVKDLLAECRTTSIQYLKCIKPNNNKLPGVFDARLVFNQIKYSGISEAVKIRESGYPIRESWSTIHGFAIQNQLYSCVLPGVHKICDRVTMFVSSLDESYYARPMLKQLLPRSYWHEGKTRIFLKRDAFLLLLSHHSAYCATAVQRRWRGIRVREDFRTLKRGFIRLLYEWRKMIRRRMWRLALHGMTLLQLRLKLRFAIRKKIRIQKCIYFSYLLNRWRVNIKIKKRKAVSVILLLMKRPIWKRKLNRFIFLVYTLQALCRGNLCRWRFLDMKAAAQHLQCFWKRYLLITKWRKTARDASRFARRANLVLLGKSVLNKFRVDILGLMKRELFAAARNGDVDPLLQYLTPDPTSPPLLRSAIGSPTAVVSLRDEYCGFQSLCHVASEAGSVAFVKVLLAGGADITAVDVNGENSLHRLVAYGDAKFDMVNFLLRENVKLLKRKNYDGENPVQFLNRLIQTGQLTMANTAMVRNCFQSAIEGFKDSVVFPTKVDALLSSWNSSRSTPTLAPVESTSVVSRNPSTSVCVAVKDSVPAIKLSESDHKSSSTQSTRASSSLPTALSPLNLESMTAMSESKILSLSSASPLSSHIEDVTSGRASTLSSSRDVSQRDSPVPTPTPVHISLTSSLPESGSALDDHASSDADSVSSAPSSSRPAPGAHLSKEYKSHLRDINSVLGQLENSLENFSDEEFLESSFSKYKQESKVHRFGQSPPPSALTQYVTRTSSPSPLGGYSSGSSSGDWKSSSKGARRRRRRSKIEAEKAEVFANFSSTASSKGSASSTRLDSQSTLEEASPKVFVPSFGLRSNKGRRRSAYRNDYGEWVVEADYFQTAVKDLAIAQSRNVQDNSTVDSNIDRPVPPSSSSATQSVGEVRSRASPLHVDTAIPFSSSSPSLQTPKSRVLSGPDLSKARRSSILGKYFNDLIDPSSQKVPTIFEHFKEFIDTKGNFKFEETKASLQAEALAERDRIDSAPDGVGEEVPQATETSLSLAEVDYFDDDVVEEEAAPVRVVYSYTEEDLIPKMAPFEADKEKRRLARRQAILDARENKPDISLAKLKPTTPDSVRSHNLALVKADVEYSKSVAHHKALLADPVSSYLMNKHKIPST